MFEEVDFTKEARNMKEFGTFLDQTGMRMVATVPFVYEQVRIVMTGMSAQRSACSLPSTGVADGDCTGCVREPPGCAQGL